jgi:phenylalanyl-tRNA synthetase beta chain
MKFSLDWLREWIDLPDSVEELENRLTVAGLEIEEILRGGPDLSALRVGQVLEHGRHPDADRLSLCQVDLGEGDPLAIVCGAPNVAAGQKVAVATHGVTLPDGTRIKRSKIRGVVSNGMICSRRELGLGDESEGILVLADDAPVGAPLPQVLPAGDVVLDVEITPNRGDWVSMLGMAREVRAHFGGTLCMPPLDCSETGTPAQESVRVAVEDAAGCHRYVARVVRGVRVGPSPEWLQRRLEAAGLRAINNVVDVTNLVMLALGQPLHAFDLAKLRGGVVRVRAAATEEKIATLDGQTRQLTRDDLVIADDGGAIAIAGVMGGSDSEVTDATDDILIESAHFHPSRVRRTARRLGLHSDASYRFERGVDPEGTSRAASRAARLIQELAGGEIAPGAVEGVGDPPPRTTEIRLEPARANRLLGTDIDADAMIGLLARVDIVAEPAGEQLVCRPPSYRNDLHIPEDLVEEVARVHGYDRIEPTLPAGELAGASQPAARALQDAARDALCAAGLIELMTFSAFASEDLERLRLAEDDPRRRAVAIQNPIQAGMPLLRTTLVPSLLRAAQLNLARQLDAVRVFEVSRVFRARAAGELPEERLEAAALVAGEAAAGFWERSDVPLFFRAKGVAERLLEALQHDAAFRAGSDEPFLHPAVSGHFEVGGRRVCAVGDLHPETAAQYGIEAAAALVVVDLEALVELPTSPRRYAAVSLQPRARRDLAVLLDRDVPAGEVLEAIRRTAGSDLQDATMFDRYEGRGVAEGKVSVAFRLDFQRLDRAMTDAEVGKATDKVVRMLAKRFDGELRG